MAEVKPAEIELKSRSNNNHDMRRRGLEWKNITFEVKNKRKILKGISGGSASFTAIMGTLSYMNNIHSLSLSNDFINRVNLNAHQVQVELGKVR